MSSPSRSELPLVPADGLHATPEDVAALRRARTVRVPSLFEDPQWLAPSWPMPADLAKRRTAEGRDPFEL